MARHLFPLPGRPAWSPFAGFSRILNSCTNLILTRMESGETFDQAVATPNPLGSPKQTRMPMWMAGMLPLRWLPCHRPDGRPADPAAGGSAFHPFHQPRSNRRGAPFGSTLEAGLFAGGMKMAASGTRGA